MKKILSLIMSVSVFLGICTTTTVYAADEQIPDGYIGIYNIEDLYAIRYNLDKNYILMDDIDMTEATLPGGEWDNGSGWQPIGENKNNDFSGIFDGNGHTIKGLHITNSNYLYSGLFGYSSGCLKNIVLSEVCIQSNSTYVGGLVGLFAGTQIENIHVNGQIKQVLNTKNNILTVCVGGIVGGASAEVNIINCSNTALIEANVKNVCKTNSTGQVNGYMGGICGSLSNKNSVIEKCFNTGDVTGTISSETSYGIRDEYVYSYSNVHAGGIVGQSTGITTDSYNTGKVCSLLSSYADNSYYGSNPRNDVSYINSYTSGISGEGTVTKCFNTGNVTSTTSGDSAKNILVSGISLGNIESSYYLLGSAKSARYNMDDSISTAIPLTTSQFTVESAQGFLDFESTWFIDKESSINHAQLISNPEIKHVHNYSPSITNPTCTEKGYTTHTCECGKSYITDYTEQKGHSFDTWSVKVQPTCQNEGVLIRYCSKCTAYEEMSISKVEHNYYEVVTEPTCTEQGYTTHNCIYCKESFVDSYTDPSNHTEGNWIITKSATYTDAGEETLYCKDCGAVIRTKEIAKLSIFDKISDLSVWSLMKNLFENIIKIINSL